MPTITTTLTTEATFSDNNLKRYLLRKTWDENKPKLAIIMLAPSEAAGIELDNTTLLVLNNASRLGYGGVDVLNLFATLNDFGLKEAEDEDPDNLNAIVQSVQEADTELEQCICRFVRTLPERDRNVFVRRYFFTEPMPAIAERYSLTVNNVTVILSRTRKKLKTELMKEGYL